MMACHITIEQLPYGKSVQSWLKDRYGEAEANQIWELTQQNYKNYLLDLPDYGGNKNGHARAIYGGLLIFSLYPVLPDPVPVVNTKIEYWYGEEEKKARKNNLAYTIKAFPQTVPKEFKGLAHAELVLMFPERFREEVIRFMQAHE